MLEFVPALIGGMLIGLAAGIFLIFNGKIMGVSGILAGIMSFGPIIQNRDRILFVIGMLAAPFFYGLFADLPNLEITSNVALLIIGGLLVGFGSRLGSGCTSGHGVCGMGRFSKRSIVAVIVFMSTAVITVFFQNHFFA